MTFAPRTWVVGEVVQAATLNDEVRDQFASMFAAWTTYTPTWTATTVDPTIGNGSITGRYIKVGRTCHVSIILTIGSTTTLGTGAYSFGLPFTAAAALVGYIGGARLASTDTWHGQSNLGPSGTTFNATFPATSTNTRAANMSGSVPQALAATNILRASLTYQTST